MNVMPHRPILNIVLILHIISKHVKYMNKNGIKVETNMEDLPPFTGYLNSTKILTESMHPMTNV